MTIQLNRLLSHMSWANQITISHLQTLPEESLAAYVVNPEWHVAEIIHHTVQAANAYSFRLIGKSAFTLAGIKDLPPVTKISELAKLKEMAKSVDQMLLECVSLEDTQTEFTNYQGEKVVRWRSTILSQAISHATEHRAQLAVALEAKGFKTIDLDEMDLWAFESATSS